MGHLLGVKFVSILFSVYTIQNIFVDIIAFDMSRKVTMRDSMTNRPTCGGPRKAGLAPRGTNFMMGVKTNHVFRGTPFAGKAADYPMSCRGGGSTGGGNGLTLGGGMVGSGQSNFENDYCNTYCREPQITNSVKCCEDASVCYKERGEEDSLSDVVYCMEARSWLTSHPCSNSIDAENWPGICTEDGLVP